MNNERVKKALIKLIEQTYWAGITECWFTSKVASSWSYQGRTSLSHIYPTLNNYNEAVKYIVSTLQTLNVNSPVVPYVETA